MRYRIRIASAVILALTAAFAAVPPSWATTAADGKYLDSAGAPTYNIRPDGTVDFYTYAGFRRYHADCHVCHGPDGLGSAYAPPLTEMLKKLSYVEFQQILENGWKCSQPGCASYMPGFASNANVACYLDDLYVYLKARSDGVLSRGRPERREEKPHGYAAAEQACRTAREQPAVSK